MGVKPLCIYVNFWPKLKDKFVPKAAVHSLLNELSRLAKRRHSGFTSQVLIFSITAIGFLHSERDYLNTDFLSETMEVLTQHILCKIAF
jgi:hypothetical protein